MMNIFQNMSPNDWENFAAYYLENIGYMILEDASVGPDGGKDLIIKKNSVRFLVSCKNNIRSNKSVTLADEDSIPDRMLQHNTKSFIGFYATKAGDSLTSYLESSDIPHLIFEGTEISKNLENLPFMVNQSFFHSGIITQPKLFGTEYEPLVCYCGCGSDLLSPDKIDDSSCFLFVFNDDLKLEWYFNNHNGNLKSIKKFPISEFIHIKKLNAIIDEIEIFIDKSDNNVTAQFDEAFTKIVELSYQMIYPSEWNTD